MRVFSAEPDHTYDARHIRSSGRLGWLSGIEAAHGQLGGDLDLVNVLQLKLDRHLGRITAIATSRSEK
jgi:hypothetical protein